MGPGNRPIFKIPLRGFEHGNLRGYRFFGCRMDHLARLILLLCVFLAGHAFAAPCPVSYAFYGYSLTGYAEQRSPVPGSLAGAQQWCTSVCGSNYQYQGGIQDGAQGVTGYCGFWANGVWTGNRCQFTLSKVPQYIDQNNSVHSSDPGTCAVCPPNKDRDPVTNQCVCRKIPSAGLHMVTGDAYEGCNVGCSMLLSNGWYDKSANTTWGNWMQTGAACSVGEPSVLPSNDAKVEAAKRCEPGTCPGTVNGQPVCVPCTASKQAQGSSSATTRSNVASGASSGTSTSETGSESSRTSCDGASCSTTTTRSTVGPDGARVDEAITKTEPQSSFCTDNPNSPICKSPESSWGGSCASFSCDGDAVQCAQARGAWELACQLKTEATDSVVQAGTGAISGAVDASVRDQLGMNTSQVFDLASRLDSTSLFGMPGACPADVTLSLGIGSVTLPFASMCPQLNLVGVAMMGLAYLIAAFIVFRPGKGA